MFEGRNLTFKNTFKYETGTSLFIHYQVYVKQIRINSLKFTIFFSQILKLRIPLIFLICILFALWLFNKPEFYRQDHQFNKNSIFLTSFCCKTKSKFDFRIFVPARGCFSDFIRPSLSFYAKIANIKFTQPIRGLYTTKGIKNVFALLINILKKLELIKNLTILVKN